MEPRRDEIVVTEVRCPQCRTWTQIRWAGDACGQALELGEGLGGCAVCGAALMDQGEIEARPGRALVRRRHWAA